jgi:hypothetical protein
MLLPRPTVDLAYQLAVGLLSLAACVAAVKRILRREASASWYVSAAGFAAALFFLTLPDKPWEMTAVAVLTAVAGILLHAEPESTPVIDFDDSTLTRRPR